MKLAWNIFLVVWIEHEGGKVFMEFAALKLNNRTLNTFQSTEYKYFGRAWMGARLKYICSDEDLD